MRRLLALPTWQLLVALVGISAALRLWAAEAIPTPWIAPDELIYAELGRALWSTGHLTLFGQPTQFFSLLSPALAGLPLSLDDRETGYRLLQALQAGVMSLAAVPTYLWARELVSRGWALTAAALALVPPSLAYAGLVMTEVAFYPAFVLAAWAVWRALLRPEPRAQAWAFGAIVLLCAVRLQGFVVALAYVTAIALDRRRLRLHAPVLVAFGVLLVLWSAWQLRHGGPVTKVLGAYRAAGETHYSVWTTLKYVVWHVGDLVFICGVVPVVALALVRNAFARWTLLLSGWLVLQVAVFASRHIGHTAERNLFALLPLYGIGVVVWLARGAPRPPRTAAVLAVAAVAALVAFPFERFATLAAAPSNFSLVPLIGVGGNLDLLVPLAAAVLLAVCLVAPRATLPLLFVLAVVASVSTSRFVAREARAVQQLTVGPNKTWVDPLAHGPVTFLYTDDLNWEDVWQTAFWNGRVRRVYGLLGANVPSMPQRTVGPFEDGRLVFHTGRDAPAEYALASDRVALVGRALGDTSPGYTLWQLEQPFRIATWVRGLNTSSYSEGGEVEVRAYACRPSALHGALVSAEPRSVEILRNGAPYTRVDLRPHFATQIDVPAAVPEPAGARLCVFTLHGDGPFFATGLSVG